MSGHRFSKRRSIIRVIRGGHRIDPETRCETSAHGAPNECIDTLPRTRASQEPIWPPPRHENLGDHLGSVRCSSCLRFQLFCVETFSSLPKCQSNGRDFARQRQTSHLRLHVLGQQSRVEIVEGSLPQLALVAVLLKISFISWLWF